MAVSRDVVEPLGPHHDRTAFASGEEPLDRYLRQRAGQDVARSLAAVFVLHDTEPGTERIAGDSTQGALSVELTDFPADVARNLLRSPIAATLIDRLAVAASSQGQRLGADPGRGDGCRRRQARAGAGALRAPRDSPVPRADVPPVLGDEMIDRHIGEENGDEA